MVTRFVPEQTHSFMVTARLGVCDDGLKGRRKRVERFRWRWSWLKRVVERRLYCLLEEAVVVESSVGSVDRFVIEMYFVGNHCSPYFLNFCKYSG